MFVLCHYVIVSVAGWLVLISSSICVYVCVLLVGSRVTMGHGSWVVALGGVR